MTAIACANIQDFFTRRGTDNGFGPKSTRLKQCHGAELEDTDQAEALIALDMRQNDFLIFLRTGSELGNSHLFGPAKASNAGIEDLYAFLVTTLGTE